jgi:hypothetical protein
VFLPPWTWLADRMEALGATCAEFAYGRACSKVAPAISEAIGEGTLKRMSPAEW